MRRGASLTSDTPAAAARPRRSAMRRWRRMTWFRVGGPAEVLVRPADADDLARFCAALPPKCR